MPRTMRSRPATIVHQYTPNPARKAESFFTAHAATAACYPVNMLADTLLRLLGNNPAAFPDPKDKWPVIVADTIDLIVPIGIVILLILPLLIVRWRWKKFTAVNVCIALLFGALLASGGYWLNQWSYDYGFGVIWHAINDPANR